MSSSAPDPPGLPDDPSVREHDPRRAGLLAVSQALASAEARLIELETTLRETQVALELVQADRDRRALLVIGAAAREAALQHGLDDLLAARSHADRLCAAEHERLRQLSELAEHQAVMQIELAELRSGAVELEGLRAQLSTTEDRIAAALKERTAADARSAVLHGELVAAQQQITCLQLEAAEPDHAAAVRIRELQDSVERHRQTLTKLEARVERLTRTAARDVEAARQMTAEGERHHTGTNGPGRTWPRLVPRIGTADLAAWPPAPSVVELVELREGADRDPQFVDGMLDCDGAGRPAGSVRMVDPEPLRLAVDELEINPSGFLLKTKERLAVVVGTGSWDTGDRHLQAALSGRDELLIAYGATRQVAHPAGGELRQRTLPASPRDLVDALREARAVIDVPALHGNDADRARHIATLCCAGIPTIAAALSPRLRSLLGTPVCVILDEVAAADLADRAARELLSIRLRRAALATLSSTARWRAGLDDAGLTTVADDVTVLLATNRAEWIEHAIGQVNAQSHPLLELVVVLHGDDFGSNIESVVRDLAHVPVITVRAPATRTLGDALNIGLAAAGGRIVTKFDDDDFYDTDHVGDLLQALRYSQATLTGKHAEFVYIQEPDLLVRRSERGSESASRAVSGGTLTIDREDLLSLGGFRPLPRQVDQALIASVLAHGGSVYRGHGCGYVLHRHGSGHTWDVPTEYFLRKATARWEGRRLEAAGIQASPPPADPGGQLNGRG